MGSSPVGGCQKVRHRLDRRRGKRRPPGSVGRHRDRLERHYQSQSFRFRARNLVAAEAGDLGSAAVRAMTAPVFRFAPSPNGYLHLGHALSALVNADRARAAGGRLLLRIEDIDVARCRPEFEAAIYEDLAWLGLAWEQPVWRQSEHLDGYRAALEQLQGKGVIYPSFESRGEIARLVAEREAHGAWPRDPDGVPLYPGSARAMSERNARIANGAPYVLRLDMDAALAAFDPLDWRETGAGPNGESGTVAGAQGDTDELPSLRGVGRRAAGRDRRGARPGSVLVDQRASPAAGAARVAGADLPSPPPRSRP